MKACLKHEHKLVCITKLKYDQNIWQNFRLKWQQELESRPKQKLRLEQKQITFIHKQILFSEYLPNQVIFKKLFRNLETVQSYFSLLFNIRFYL